MPLTQLMIMCQNHHSTNMAGASFGSEGSSADGQGNFGATGFEASDFFHSDDWFEDGFPADFSPLSHLLNYSPNEEVAVESSSITTSHGSFFSEGTTITGESGRERLKKGIREKVAFKTKSEIEILVDGYKWRKYGKKMVKNSPNPRNYYKCSEEGCSVKKRVERDREDRRYVVTTYEGTHNHQVHQSR